MLYCLRNLPFKAHSLPDAAPVDGADSRRNLQLPQFPHPFEALQSHEVLWLLSFSCCPFPPSLSTHFPPVAKTQQVMEMPLWPDPETNTGTCTIIPAAGAVMTDEPLTETPFPVGSSRETSPLCLRVHPARPPVLLPASEVTLSKGSLLPPGPLSVPPKVENHFRPALHPSGLRLFSSRGPSYPRGSELFPEKLAPPSGGSVGSDGRLTVQLSGTEPLRGPWGGPCQEFPSSSSPS